MRIYYRGWWLGRNEAGAPSEIQRMAGFAPDLFRRFPVAVITCVDSCPELSVDMLGVHAASGTSLELRQFGAGLVTSGAAITRIASDGFFSGFDEIWFFHSMPAAALPAGMSVPDLAWDLGSAEGEASAEGVIAAATEAGALLGVGDGIGLSPDYAWGRAGPPLS